MTNVNAVCIDEDIVECLFCEDHFKNHAESECSSFESVFGSIHFCEIHYAKLVQALESLLDVKTNVSDLINSFLATTKRDPIEMSHERLLIQLTSYAYDEGLINE